MESLNKGGEINCLLHLFMIAALTISPAVLTRSTTELGFVSISPKQAMLFVLNVLLYFSNLCFVFCVGTIQNGS